MMKKEYFVGSRHKYGLMLMETIRLEEKLPGREIYKVKWTSLTDYKGLNVQILPMVRTDGEFYDFTPISKSIYLEILHVIREVNEELMPLLVVKRKIDEKICATHKIVWQKLENNN